MLLEVKFGARYWTRTSDLRHVMAALYQLS
jgi:hypothetical protein